MAGSGMLLYDPGSQPRWIIEKRHRKVSQDPVWIETRFEWLCEGDVFRVQGNKHVLVAVGDAEKLTAQTWGVRVTEAVLSVA